MKLFLKNSAAAGWNLIASKPPPKHLFIMGHPRSGSSLLMHILTSNSEIVGFGEYLTVYQDARSFRKAEFDIRRKSASLFTKCTYVANQVNHASITPNTKLLVSENIQLIVLFRKPEETLSSIFLLSQKKNVKMTQEEITSVYVDRLEHQLGLLQQVPSAQWMLINYEDLIATSEKELKRIDDFLQLKEPLGSQYALKKYTQVWGDPSENIKQGHIFATNSKLVPFNKELLQKANDAYSKLSEFKKGPPS